MLINSKIVPGCCYESDIINKEGVVEVFFSDWLAQWNRGWLLWLY